MKAILVLVLSISCCANSFAQFVAITNEKMNVAYAGIHNPITVTLEGYKSDQVVVTTDNGSLVSKGNGKYDYIPLKAGKAIIKISVKTKNGTKEIGQSIYRIKVVPIPKATTDVSASCIGGFRPPKNLIAKIDGWDLDDHFEITDFKLEIASRGSIVSTTVIKGSKLPPNVFDAMKADDRIFITEIHCIGPDKRIQTLNPIVYTSR